ncbi:MAG: twin-arginine translocation signal domain-containing protein, partial [Candidatus Acidiferrales bacterium]
MTNETSRRDFLGISALGLAAAAGSNEIPLPTAGSAGAAHDAPKTGSEISIWVTSGDERLAAAPKANWAAAPGTSGAEQILLDPGTRFQEILGFGGAFTDAACYTFNRLAPAARDQLFHEMFHPSEMGLSVCRICVGSSDYSTKLYSFDDGEADPDLKRFSIEHDREYILPMLR